VVSLWKTWNSFLYHLNFHTLSEKLSFGYLYYSTNVLERKRSKEELEYFKVGGDGHLKPATTSWSPNLSSSCIPGDNWTFGRRPSCSRNNLWHLDLRQDRRWFLRAVTTSYAERMISLQGRRNGMIKIMFRTEKNALDSGFNLIYDRDTFPVKDRWERKRRRS
jgi:hypothetical protein